MSTFPIKFDEKALENTRSRVPENTFPFQQGNDGDQYRFATTIANYCQKRYSLNRLPKDGLTFFIFIPVRHFRKVENIGKKLLRLKSNNQYELSNKLVISLGDSLRKCQIIEVDPQETDIWNKMAELLNEIEDICDEELCHSIVDYLNSEITVQYTGEDDNKFEQVLDFTTSQKIFTKQELEDFTNEFHDTETKLPTGNIGIWLHPNKYELLTNAEDRITNAFAVKLSAILGKSNIFREPQDIHGRIDLYIHPSALERDIGPCVMEFKVLREGDGPQKNNERLHEGVLQALDYGKDKHAKTLYLMAYDARKKLGKIDAIKQLADKHEVIYLHFEMYNSVPGERKKIIAETKKNNKKACG
ncbi:hypothetical protein SG34_021205 [Thalassomonas viridans]|uniref:Uncharacterized protein n=1 Tax=Thalassomonas viridans TaxID=137584 RepID=A0AAF0C8H2_9GAMM|nr:hypothetical protein [Thalassomonas viridans]WDE03869.1 hypothetical protein SG34_021205 [Thalassomonas viridans]